MGLFDKLFNKQNNYKEEHDQARFDAAHKNAMDIINKDKEMKEKHPEMFTEDEYFRKLGKDNEASENGFRMQIEDVFSIKNRGTVLCGRVFEGVVQLGDVVVVNNEHYKVIGLEMFRKLIKSAQKGDNIGLLINGTDPELFHRGDWVYAEQSAMFYAEQSAKMEQENSQAAQMAEEQNNENSGVVEYVSPINNEPFFRLINFGNGNLYAVELSSLSGNVLSDTSWVPGDSGHALFALTKDEFDLKNKDENKLTHLISELYNNIPEDRLIDSYYISMDNKRKEMTLCPKCKTMDNNKFDEYRQRIYSLKTGIPFLNTAEKVYMIYNKVTTDRLPAMTWDGYANVFTKLEYAQNIISNSDIDTLGIKEFNKVSFDEHIKTWHAFGILKFNMNAGTNDHACTIMCDDYMPDPYANEWMYNGSALCMYLLRYRQYSAINTEAMQAMAMTFFNLFCHEIKETLFLCPFLYDNENPPLPQPDHVIHTSQGSIDLITKKSLSDMLNDSELLYSKNKYEVSLDDKKIMLTNEKIKFYGGEKYKLANPENVRSTGVMNLLSVNGSSGVFLPAFTDFTTLHSIFDENARVSVHTYNELRAIAENSESLDGIVINPNSMTMPILKKDMELIENTIKEGTKVYVPKLE